MKCRSPVTWCKRCIWPQKKWNGIYFQDLCHFSVYHMKFPSFEFFEEAFLTFSIVKGYFQKKNRRNNIINWIGLKLCRYTRHMLEHLCTKWTGIIQVLRMWCFLNAKCVQNLRQTIFNFVVNESTDEKIQVKSE